MTEWLVLVEEMEAVKRRAAANDRENLWHHESRRPPAEPQRIAEIAMVTRCPVDREYADFLAHADGWPAILQDIDLFGTTEFDSAAFVEADELVRVTEDEVMIGGRDGLVRWVPIGASRTDIDVLVMPCVSESNRSAPVIWLAGAEVERYETFSSFFRAMIAENDAEAESLA